MRQEKTLNRLPVHRSENAFGKRTPHEGECILKRASKFVVFNKFTDIRVFLRKDIFILVAKPLQFLFVSSLT